MAEIKAIETQYKGYRFRSRLEARWAVFFDAVGMKYEYEPEGIQIPTPYSPDPICYLPDFYLIDHDIYVEIKPRKIDPPYDDETWGEIGHKPGELSIYLRRPAAWLIVGTPGYSEVWDDPVTWPYLIHRLFVELNGERAKERKTRRVKMARWSWEVFCKCRECHAIWPEGSFAGYFGGFGDGCGDRSLDPLDRDLCDALTSARSARFEFGESGTR